MTDNIHAVKDILYPGLRWLEGKYGLREQTFVADSNTGALYVSPSASLLVTQAELDAGLTLKEVSNRLNSMYEPKDRKDGVA